MSQLVALFSGNSALTAVNGEIAMIWFGSAVSPQIIDDLYGVESAEELDIRMVRRWRPWVDRTPADDRHVCPSFLHCCRRKCATS